jgi:hypothetical protein
MNRALLEQPFAPEQVKQRKGNFGQMLDYIEGHAVIQRLNDATDGRWSFEITERETFTESGEVLVLGKLTAGDVIKMQFGSSAITRAKESGEILSLADDFKAAATDALKKCATQLGVGLYLYTKKYQPVRQNRAETLQQPAGSNAPIPFRRKAGNSNGNGAAGKGGRISQKQHGYILKLLQDNGKTRAEFDRECVEKYGTVLDHLSKTDASVVINELLN